MFKFIGIFFLVFVGLYNSFAISPTVMIDFNLPRDLYLDAGEIYSFTIVETNFDTFREAEILFEVIISDNEDYSGWFYPSSILSTVAPDSNNIKSVKLVVPSDLCSGTYLLMLREKTVDYENRVMGSFNIYTAVGHKLNLHVNNNNNNNCVSSIPLPGLYPKEEYVEDYVSISINVYPAMNLIYHDFDGDRVYEPDEYDVPIDSGFAYFYNSDDVLLSTTDLSVTGGYYDVPSSSTPSNNDFYLIVETDKFDDIDPTIKDKSWEGNLFVDRKGTYTNKQNIYLFEDVNYLGDIIDNIDIRSRNTDQQGTWDSGTITVGPDDKDQVISPIRWDYLVEGTDFPYVDLDHDGRIDPDDKDHIISPLYWDFPN